ncbi:S-methyl-5-thioribose-1-phosphate isomerase [Chloroflexota bacterium]
MTNPAIRWQEDKAIILDQTKLPHKEVLLKVSRYQDMASAITELKIRGAPAIGVAGGYGAVLGALKIEAASIDEFHRKFHEICQVLSATRPTAKNLFIALERMEQIADKITDINQAKKVLTEEAVKIHNEEIKATRRISQIGTELIKDGEVVLTHCNAGPLATTGYGTALGVIIEAHKQGKKIRVFTDETRPLLQGARLSTWELKNSGVPVTLITDSMAGHFMNRGEISCVILGADRIAANGDTANKIGTYSVSVLAKENNVPFYVAAPTTTFDISLSSGRQIPIEERKPEEVTHFQGVSTAPEGIGVANPAFDVTPHRYITAIITDRGILRGPFTEGIRKLLR